MALWTIDPNHSCAAFAIRHMTLAHVRGQFTKMQGSIRYDPADRSRVSVNVEIDVASVFTGNKNRDAHLLTADFFDQGKYPVIKFSGTSVEFLDGNRIRVNGSLTIRGTTQPVVFEGEYAGPLKTPYGGEITVGFSGSIKINREDFGIMWGSELMEGGGLIAGKEVQIFLDVEADLAE